tara:strand:- start:510 stop:902 length:393 start_codon:yes stop_codon:yes gene_type:complete
MASQQSVQEVRQLADLLGPIQESIPDEVKGVLTETSYNYVKALREVGADPQTIQQYVSNGADMAREMHSVGMKSGQLKKFLDEKNMEAVQQIVQQREAKQLQQMQEMQRQRSIMAANAEVQNLMNQGQLG